MQLLTEEQLQQLKKNGLPNNRSKDHFPVAKLFTPDAGATWLLTELDYEDPSIAFGLCDLGLGFPEIGYVSLEELKEVRGRLGLPIEQDKYFESKFPLSVYAEAARMMREVTERNDLLEKVAIALKTKRKPKPL
ncbi:DUF2958 domain-containing protein [Emticicia sp. 17c]|uniref:DUF2958 domain-containing protein n=1 Tax=Emticicia sp. 17c TaxID=3127704 RepID=UPI00301D727A